jgi:hypothetical protein
VLSEFLTRITVQGKLDDLPRLLSYGYVFLANSAA